MAGCEERMKKKILSFEKPVKVKFDVGFEDGPIGGYYPQMAREDAKKWKAKRYNAGKPGDRIEIRKSTGWTQIHIIVAKDGWDYAGKFESRGPKDRCRDTTDKNFRMSMNGPILLSWDEFEEMQSAIAEAKKLLELK